MDAGVGPESSEFWVWRINKNLGTREIQEAVLSGLFVSSLNTYTKVKPFNLKW